MTKRRARAILEPSEVPAQLDGTDRLLNALAETVAESLDISALASKIAAPVGVAVAQGISLQALIERVVEAISAKIAQDEELLREVGAVVIKALTQ